MSDYGMQSRTCVCSLSLPTRASSHGLSFLGDPYPHRDLYPGGSVGLGRGILQRVCILSTPRN